MTNARKALSGDQILDTPDITAVESNEIRRLVEARHVVCLRGLFAADEIALARQVLQQGFDPARDGPSKGEAPDAIMDNYQKLAIGGGRRDRAYNPRLMRVIYNPLWAEDRYGLHQIFRELARLRNRLQGYMPDFALDRVEDGLWTAARIQHYPVGGGFLAPHRDTVLASKSRDAGAPIFLQPVLLLTKAGSHFETGGGWVQGADGQKLHYEAFCEPGDVVLYDGQRPHGVDDIDPHKALNLGELTGRLTAVASLYRDLSQAGQLFEGYENRVPVEGARAA